MKRGLQVAVFGVVSILALLLGGCGSDDGDSVIVEPGTIGETTTETVSAQSGGTVALASGVASITIPAGALTTDTEISITTTDNAGAADEARLASFIFDFGPEGTTFSSPVTISLKAGASAPSGKKAVLAVLNGDTWEEISGSSVSGDVVSAPVSHFSRYVVYFTDSGDVIIDNESALCKELTFSACGGDPSGSWVVEDYCIETRSNQGGNNMFGDIAACQGDNVISATDVDYTGSLDLNTDGSFTEDFRATSAMEMIIKKACLEGILATYGEQAAGVTAAEYCDTLGSQMTGGISGATYEYKDGACHISTPSGGSNPTNAVTGTWSVDGSNLVMTVDGNTISNAFCVSGSRLVIEFTKTESNEGVETTYNDHFVLKKN